MRKNDMDLCSERPKRNRARLIAAGVLISVLLLHLTAAAEAPTVPVLQPPPEAADAARERARLLEQVSTKGLLNISFYQCEIREVLLALAMKRGLNVIMDQDVTGKVSVHLNQLKVEDAMDAIIKAGGFGYHRQGEIYHVYKLKTTLDPSSDLLQIRVFKLKFVTPDKVQDIIGAIPGLRTIKIHEPSRTIIAEDTPENLKKIALLVQFWDTLPRQVLIEAKILEISLTDDMNFGVDWQKVIGSVTIGTTGFKPAGSGFFANVVSGPSSSQLTAALNALQTKTKVNTISTPKILALHGKAARVQVGGKRGYKTATTNLGVTTESIQFIDTGTILDITPWIDDENNIMMSVQPSINSVTLDADKIPIIRSTTVSTTLMAKNGETIFIGGLIENSRSNTLNAIPCIGNIPGLGILFGQRNRSINKSEFVVLITPQLMNRAIMNESMEEKKKAERQEKKLQVKSPPPGKDVLDTLAPENYSEDR